MRKRITRLNPKKYAKLLASVAPQPITTEEQHQSLLSATSRLMQKERTPEETILLRLLSVLVEEYESRRYAHLSPGRMTPAEKLDYLMQENRLTQNAFAPAIPQSRISDILGGRRRINTAQAKVFADRFKVEPSFFLY